MNQSTKHGLSDTAGKDKKEDKHKKSLTKKTSSQSYSEDDDDDEITIKINMKKAMEKL